MKRKASSCLAAIMFSVAGAAAQVPPADPAAATPQEAALEPAAEGDAGARLAADLAVYVQGMADAVRTRDDVAGLIVSVVKDDRLLLAAGYGDAVIEPERAADGERTLFRIGSISKTFTYTAAMQLIERGVIGLDDPVNEYLPEAIRVPADGFAQPVLVRHLLTHTAGFEDSALGHLFVRDPEKEMSLDDYLARHRPRRVRAPGTAAVYSNYSVALLGALVAHKSGMLFEDYIEQHVTGPLALTRTTFREPLPEGDPRRLDATLAADIAAGYRRENGAFVKGEFEYIAHGAPAGGVSTTAADMARWMRVHLNAGELDGVRILGADSALRMREILFRNAPDVPGIGYGFLTENYGPYFAYGHGGATLYFHSGMVLLPELNLGVFVSANTADARAAVRDVVRLIVEHLAPEAAATPTPVAMPREQLQRFAGTYRGNRRPYSTAEKAVFGLSGDTEVDVADDGSLRIHAGPEPIRVVPVGPMTFQDADGNTRVQFYAGADGAITGFTYGFGIAALDRIGWLDTGNALFLLLALAALIAIVRLARGFRRYKRNPPRPGRFPVKALSLLNAVAWLAFIAVAVFAAVRMIGEGSDVVYTYPSPMFLAALVLATVAAVLTALEVLAVVPVWTSRWRAWPKLRYTLAVAVLALTVCVLWTWNLVGMNV